VNHKRVYKLCHAEDLGVRSKKRKKRASYLRVVPAAPTGEKQRWCMDFVTDRLEDGHHFRILTVVDVFTRECLALHADRHLSGRKVAQVLEGLGQQRELAQEITVDNGTEFFSKDMDAWCQRHGVRLDFIRPGRPVENPYLESFNGKFRDECLSQNWFLD